MYAGFCQGFIINTFFFTYTVTIMLSAYIGIYQDDNIFYCNCGQVSDFCGQLDLAYELKCELRDTLWFKTGNTLFI